GHDRQTADEFWNHAERQQVFRFHPSHRFAGQRRLHLQSWTAKTHHFLADTFLHDFVEADKCAAANEQNFFGINLDVFLVRMLAPALWRNVAGAPLKNFQQRLLHAFAANITNDQNVVGFTADFIDLVNVNDSNLGMFHVLIQILHKTPHIIFDVYTYIDGKGHSWTSAP